MLSMHTILENLTAHNAVEAFVQWMAAESEDFHGDRQRYTCAIDALGKELGEAVTDEVAAIEQQCFSNLLFSGWLGLKANLDHFIDPVARNFLEVDFELFLREETAHSLPQYQNAQQRRDRFYALLTPVQAELYKDITAYTSHLETVAPKLAHYYGYILGNRLLPQIIPGYRPNMALTVKYNAMLENYLGNQRLPLSL